MVGEIRKETKIMGEIIQFEVVVTRHMIKEYTKKFKTDAANKKIEEEALKELHFKIVDIIEEYKQLYNIELYIQYWAAPKKD